MKRLYMALTLVLVALSLVLLAGFGPSSVNSLRFLQAQGNRIVTDTGVPVNLRGVNLGGWLVEEIWMLPFKNTPPAGTDFKPIDSHVTLWKTLEARLGQEEMLKIRKAWRETWITKEDLKIIKAAGLNCIRLPVLYDSMEDPDKLYPWIDLVLKWAREVGLYVVLDLHGAPGRQSSEHHTGESKVDRLFKDPTNVDACVEVWKQLARRYRNHAEVAGFDLLNEPMGAPNDATLYIVTDRLYRAVRETDSRHIIFIEDGYKGVHGMPNPAVVGWKNVVLSIHSYKFNAKSEEDHVNNLNWLVKEIGNYSSRYSIPFYVGEFNIEPHGSGSLMKQYIDAFDKNGISWSLWTYKSAMRGGGGGMWGWYLGQKTIPTIDPYTDSVDQILEKIAQLKTSEFEESPVGEAFLK